MVIIILFSVFAIVLFITINFKYIPQLEACEIERVLPKKLVNKNINKKVLIGDTLYNLEKYETFYVEGDSMLNYGIQSGEYVFVERLKTYELKTNIKNKPLVVLNLKYKGSDYFKPYKFIRYLDIDKNLSYIDWRAIYNNISRDFKIKIRESVFKSSIFGCLVDIHQLSNKFIIVEAYDIDDMKFVYKAFRIEQLYGIIKYTENQILED